jgi:hypothetical protein
MLSPAAPFYLELNFDLLVMKVEAKQQNPQEDTIALCVRVQHKPIHDDDLAGAMLLLLAPGALQRHVHRGTDEDAHAAEKFGWKSNPIDTFQYLTQSQMLQECVCVPPPCCLVFDNTGLFNWLTQPDEACGCPQTHVSPCRSIGSLPARERTSLDPLHKHGHNSLIHTWWTCRYRRTAHEGAAGSVRTRVCMCSSHVMQAVYGSFDRGAVHIHGEKCAPPTRSRLRQPRTSNHEQLRVSRSGSSMCNRIKVGDKLIGGVLGHYPATSQQEEQSPDLQRYLRVSLRVPGGAHSTSTPEWARTILHKTIWRPPCIATPAAWSTCTNPGGIRTNGAMREQVLGAGAMN